MHFSFILGNERTTAELEASIGTRSTLLLVRCLSLGLSVSAGLTGGWSGFTYGATKPPSGPVESFATVGPVMITVTLPFLR